MNRLPASSNPNEKPPKMATPPRAGISLRWILWVPGGSLSFLCLATLTIFGSEYSETHTEPAKASRRACQSFNSTGVILQK
ncbi:MAG: hypothetical protein GT598_15060 [Bacteroidales bacterium]|nr:hypothetical protein [Bacteroidales bacterium]